MTPLDALTLRPRASDIPTSDAQLDGHSWRVRGAALEGAWRIGPSVLVATTDDVPYEEALHFTLWTQRGWTEHLTLSAAYATGLFRLRRTRDTTVSFAFFGDAVWRLSVLERPRFHIPRLQDPPGFSRPLQLRTRLAIDSPDSINS